MNILFVVRSTRADEEDGRLNCPFPTCWPLVLFKRSIITAVITNLLLALLIALGSMP
ncbi:MAG: hypothetical protein RJR35_05825 [Thermoanaerobacterales bacterium]|nr:hypothetical protein [Thermoanaerobacterales bacterium]